VISDNHLVLDVLPLFHGQSFPFLVGKIMQTPVKIARWANISSSAMIITGWWFGTFGLFSISYMGCHPNPIDFHIFKMVETTNQIMTTPARLHGLSRLSSDQLKKAEDRTPFSPTF